MRHIFVVHLAADIGGTDPEDLMVSVEEAITETFDAEAIAGRLPLRDADVECVDAYETDGVAV